MLQLQAALLLWATQALIGNYLLLAQSHTAQPELLVALLPDNGPLGPSHEVQWKHLTWGNQSASSVHVEAANMSDPAVSHSLGAWASLVLGTNSPALTCRVDPSKANLFCYEARTPKAAMGLRRNGCCADTLTRYSREAVGSGGAAAAVATDILPLIRSSLLGDGMPRGDAMSAFGSHTFDIGPGDGSGGSAGSWTAVLMVSFNSSRLSGCTTDAMVMLSIKPDGTATVVPTAAGKLTFLPYRDIGTFSTDPEDTIRHVQYVQNCSAIPRDRHISQAKGEQWHGNGVVRFVDQAGRPLLAFTHRLHHEAVVVNDPWRPSEAPPGEGSSAVRILQRFGTPRVFDSTGQPAGLHFLGVNRESEGAEGLYGGVHNLWHTTYPDGSETLTTFCNVQGGDRKSKVYEFELRVPPSRPSGAVEGLPSSLLLARPHAVGVSLYGHGAITETTAEMAAAVNLRGQRSLACHKGTPPRCEGALFPTTYRRANLDFTATTQGGARVLSEGLYLVAGGGESTFEGFAVADVVSNFTLHIPYHSSPVSTPFGFYDPFVAVELLRDTAVGCGGKAVDH